ncbi:MAG: ABC transporter ATP-binding protein [Bacillota bacterium]|nr:ABC transporter ATP-binding protein [Bacillota bacterium]
MKGIQIEELSKSYGKVRALDRVSVTFEEQKLYGLLGRNGAGKSTLLNIAANRIFADEGRVLVDGEPAMENDRAQGKLYLMSEQNDYPEKMKIRDVFRWSKDFYPGFDEVYAREIAGRFGLNLNKKTSALSTGYNSIFKIVVGLSVNTPYVLFDEPVLGLDANHRDLFYRLLLEKYAETPFTAVISTHIIEEMAHVIERVVIIDRGRILRDSDCESLLAGCHTVSGPAAAVEEYLEGRSVLNVETLGGLKTAYVEGAPEGGPLPAGLETGKADLQKLFIQLTNEGGENK